MEENTRILLVEDDKQLAELERDYLSQNGFEVRWVSDGRAAEEAVKEFEPDVVLLDLVLPGVSGLDVCRQLRNFYKGRILFLTGSGDDFDHVACLELGADDFVSKPIQMRVLLARIRMLLRREQTAADEMNSEQELHQLNFGRLWLNKKSREVKFADEVVSLTMSEFNLLWLLASQADEVLDRNYLFKELRGIEFDGTDRYVDTKIVSLRKKLSDSEGSAKRIITIRSKGYLFVSDAWA